MIKFFFVSCLPHNDKAMTMKLSNIQILILRLAIGGLFLSIGINKINDGWLHNPEPLRSSLTSFHEHAGSAQRTYLDLVAIPYASVWSVLMAIGETAIGASLLLGVCVRLSALVGILMVFNFYAANGSIYSLNFFGSPWSAFLSSGLLILFLARAGRWAGVDALMVKMNPKGFCW
jgi:uncharacterized membrane protein YphA (DoxX/SURF4 family)